MSTNTAETKEKIKAFLVRYGYLMLAGVLIVAFIVSIIALATSNKNEQVGVSNQQATLSFYLPIADATITKNYNGNALQYNATLNQWEVHKGIDFSAPVGTEVCSVSAGKVTDIYNNYLEGTVVVISHANNLTSKYGSLDEDVNVNVGDTVSGGQVIGTVATSAKGELSESSHLHFEMLENDKKIDPSAYLDISNK